MQFNNNNIKRIGSDILVFKVLTRPVVIVQIIKQTLTYL